MNQLESLIHNPVNLFDLPTALALASFFIQNDSNLVEASQKPLDRLKTLMEKNIVDVDQETGFLKLEVNGIKELRGLVVIALIRNYEFSKEDYTYIKQQFETLI